jgi:hypothetical protein
MIMPIEPPDASIPQAVLDEMNRRLAGATHAHNTAPDPEMGGLSPEQVTRLVYSEWGAAGSPIRFNTDIPLTELAKASFFREARTLLKAVLDSGGVRATPSGNLPRAFVSAVLPLMCDADALAEVYRYRKAVNEQDVRPLHIARVVAQTAGLLRLQKGIFTLPRAKESLLSDAQAGELYRGLFVAFFRKFNLAYAHPFAVAARGLQTCVGYTLYRLGIVASDWLAADALSDQALLPAVRDEIAAGIRGHVYWTVSRVMTGRLVSPLIQWGLLEGHYEPLSEYARDLKTVRITPLYKAFLRFDLQA